MCRYARLAVALDTVSVPSPRRGAQRQRRAHSSVVRAWYASVVFGEVAWDEASEAHVARHAVTPDEVEDVLFCRPRLVQAGLHGTTYVMGTTLAGRYLLVVVAEAGRGGVYVVTVREMTEAERRRFRRRAR